MNDRERIAAAAAYIPVIGRIVVVFLPARRSAHVRFHMFQSLLVSALSYIGVGALALLRDLPVAAFLERALGAADLLLYAVLALAALLARPLALPGLGYIARKLAERAGAVRPEPV